MRRLERLSFDEKWFFFILLAFTPNWDFKPTNVIHVDSPGVHTSDKFLNLSTIDEIHIKCVVIVESVLNSLRQTIFFSFVLKKASGFEILQSYYEKINMSVLNTKTF